MTRIPQIVSSAVKSSQFSKENFSKMSIALTCVGGPINCIRYTGLLRVFFLSKHNQREKRRRPTETYKTFMIAFAKLNDTTTTKTSMSPQDKHQINMAITSHLYICNEPYAMQNILFEHTKEVTYVYESFPFYKSYVDFIHLHKNEISKRPWPI